MSRRTPISSLLLASAIGGLGLASPAARAQEDRARLDPLSVIQRLRENYRSRPFVETVEIDAQGEGQHKRETVRIASDGHGNVRLELDQLLLWTESTTVYAVNRLNAGVMFQAPLDSSDRAASFHKAIPSLPLPQLDMALAGKQPGRTPAPTHASKPGPADKESVWSPLPSCPLSTWELAQAMQDHGRTLTTMRGQGDTCRVALALVGDPPRFVEVKAVTGAALGTIDLKVDRLEEPVGKLGDDLRGRRTVDALADLKPITDDVTPGLAMPRFVLQPLDPSAAKGRSFLPEKQGYLVLIARSAEAAAATAPKVKALGRAKGVATRFVAVAPLADHGARDGLTKVFLDLGVSESCGVSFSARTTIDRFASASGGVAVCVDAAGLVCAVVPADAPDFVDRLEKGADAAKGGSATPH